MTYDNLIIGIDPGKTGGACFIWIKNNTIQFFDLYRFQDIDIIDLGYCKSMTDKIDCYLENLVKSSTDFASKAIEYGRNFGFWEGYLKAHKIEINYIQPFKWQSWIAPGLVGMDKDTRKNGYHQIANEFIKEFKVSKALADAVCIAKYGFEKTEL